MPDDLAALLLREEIMETRERRLLLREERRMLRVEMVRRIAWPLLGFGLAALGVVSLSMPR
jgi:hypothetical protein